MTITAQTLLASIEAIPETPENFRQFREAVREAKALVELEATRTEYAAAITGSGNVWLTFPTRDEAQAFIDEAPVPMHVLARQACGETHGRWVHA
jgi:hypothetical protein